MTWQAVTSTTRGMWTLYHDGAEAGTFSTLTDLRYPATVLGKVCDALNADEQEAAA